MSKVVELLRDKACYYLDHTCETIDKSLIHVPSYCRLTSHVQLHPVQSFPAPDLQNQ